MRAADEGAAHGSQACVQRRLAIRKMQNGRWCGADALVLEVDECASKFDQLLRKLKCPALRDYDTALEKRGTVID